MKRAPLHLGWLLILALVAWWLLGDSKPAAEPTGEVELGDPVVTGSSSEAFGGTDYATTPRVARDPLMQQLIDESNALLDDPSSLNSPQPPGGT